MSLEKEAKNYFRTLNAITKRLHEDFEETEKLYEHFWSDLTQKQRDQILSESIIKPEVSIKYGTKQTRKDSEHFAQKIVLDEHCSYQDEHSAPFSLRTASQRNLILFKDTSSENTEASEMVRPVVQVTNQKPENLPKADPEDAAKILPKTGLDFLDNW